jgi:hypothetical protein
MTFAALLIAFIVAPIILAIIPVYLPRARGSIVSLNDAGMFAACLVALVLGTLEIVKGLETWGWILVMLGAGMFGQKMFTVFNRLDRK